MPLDDRLENRTTAVPGLQMYDKRVYQDSDLRDGTEPHVLMWRASVTDSSFLRYSFFFPAGRATKCAFPFSGLV